MGRTAKKHRGIAWISLIYSFFCASAAIASECSFSLQSLHDPLVEYQNLKTRMMNDAWVGSSHSPQETERLAFLESPEAFAPLTRLFKQAASGENEAFEGFLQLLRSLRPARPSRIDPAVFEVLRERVSAEAFPPNTPFLRPAAAAEVSDSEDGLDAQLKRLADEAEIESLLPPHAGILKMEIAPEWREIAGAESMLLRSIDRVSQNPEDTALAEAVLMFYGDPDLLSRFVRLWRANASSDKLFRFLMRMTDHPSPVAARWAAVALGAYLDSENATLSKKALERLQALSRVKIDDARKFPDWGSYLPFPNLIRAAGDVFLWKAAQGFSGSTFDESAKNAPPLQATRDYEARFRLKNFGSGMNLEGEGGLSFFSSTSVKSPVTGSGTIDPDFHSITTKYVTEAQGAWWLMVDRDEEERRYVLEEPHVAPFTYAFHRRSDFVALLKYKILKTRSRADSGASEPRQNDAFKASPYGAFAQPMGKLWALKALAYFDPEAAAELATQWLPMEMPTGEALSAILEQDLGGDLILKPQDVEAIRRAKPSLDWWCAKFDSVWIALETALGHSGAVQTTAKWLAGLQDGSVQDLFFDCKARRSRR